MIRRSLLKGLMAMGLTWGDAPPPRRAGHGGNPPMRPDQAIGLPRSRSGSGPAPTNLITFARTVIVFGPTGAVVGVFVYAPGTTPGLGNPPIASMTGGTKDPYGNTVKSGTASYDNVNKLLSRLFHGTLELNSFSSTTQITQPGAVSLTDANTVAQGPSITVQSPNVAGGANASSIFMQGESADLTTKQAQVVVGINGSSGATTAFCEVQGTANVSGVFTPGAGTNSSGSAPSPGQSLVINAAAAQLSDLTRDYMLYLTFSGAGNVTVQIGPTSAVGRTVYPTAANVPGAPYPVRIPAGWFVKCTGTGAVAIASQTVVGC